MHAALQRLHPDIGRALASCCGKQAGCRRKHAGSTSQQAGGVSQKAGSTTQHGAACSNMTL